jgi:hypothetical protein
MEKDFIVAILSRLVFLTSQDLDSPEAELANICIQQALAEFKGSEDRVILYGLKEKGVDKIRYVGQTSSTLKKRFSAHRCDVNRNLKTPKSDWIKSVLSRGSDVEIFQLEQRALKNISERYWIAFLRYNKIKLLNCTKGGEGNFGFRHSPETKEKMSKKRKGSKLSTYHKKRISEGQKGKQVTELTKLNISRALKGKKLAESVKLKMSQTRRGRKLNLTEAERKRRSEAVSLSNKTRHHKNNKKELEGGF